MNHDRRDLQVADQHGGDAHRGHVHVSVTAHTDRRWLAASFAVIVAFMIGEVIVGLLSHSLALIADAGHMLTDAAAIGLAIAASKLAQRPARGAYTYGFARLDAVSAQANGITLLLLSVWFAIQAVRRLLSPPPVHGGAVFVTALIGIGVNLAAVLLASKANKASLNVRGAVSHIVNDLWAFVATAVAGLVIVFTGWTRADALASLVVAGLMVYSGLALVRAAGRVFLEAAPAGVSPATIGAEMASVDGVVEVHDLHVWDLGASEAALSAHVVVDPARDCHQVAESVRAVLRIRHGIGHATLQADHRHRESATQSDPCAGDTHGPGYVSAFREPAAAEREPSSSMSAEPPR